MCESDPEKFVKVTQWAVETMRSLETEADTREGEFGVEIWVQGERGVWV